MSAVRPFVSVHKFSNPAEVVGEVPMPSVLSASVRPDLVRYVHTQVAKNARQAYAVSTNTGYQSSAESWGTGRAVARIPRVAGGGTHRAGQGAFGNQCRGGGMFAPTKVWRRWHRCVNITEKRHAIASALASAAVVALVMARGHKIDAVPEIPCVVSNDIEQVDKTKNAVSFLTRLGAAADIERVQESRVGRAGQGKRRNNKYKQRKGPLFVYSGEPCVAKAFRNIPGIDTCHVSRLNLLQLAPGGSVGRFIIYSQSAFEKLAEIYGTPEQAGMKKGYTLQRPMMTNTDLARLINSNEIQSALKPAAASMHRRRTQHKNPLRNHAVACRLDPSYKVRKMEKKTQCSKKD